MNTLDQYMPKMQEAAGRLSLPPKTAIGTVIAALLLVLASGYAVRYPTMKAEEAIAQIATYNGLTESAQQATQTRLARVPGLLASSPKWLQDVAAKRTAALQAQMAQAKPVTPDNVLQATDHQQAAYDKAQRLIAASPFRNLPLNQMPQSPAGQAYLQALQVAPPARFKYQRLTDGEGLALNAYKAMLAMQVQAEQFVRQVDVQANGDKAAPLGAVAAAANNPVLTNMSASAASSPPDDPMTMMATIMGNHQPPSSARADNAAPSDQSDTTNTPDPFAVAAAQAKAEQDRQQAQAAAAIEQARLKVQHENEQAAVVVQQAKLKAQMQQQQAAYAGAQAKRQAEQQQFAAQQAAAERQSKAKAAAVAKARECTSSLVNRLTCASQGYNPITGVKG
jgi:hypothetical protein